MRSKRRRRRRRKRRRRRGRKRERRRKRKRRRRSDEAVGRRALREGFGHGAGQDGAAPTIGLERVSAHVVGSRCAKARHVVRAADAGEELEHEVCSRRRRGCRPRNVAPSEMPVVEAEGRHPRLAPPLATASSPFKPRRPTAEAAPGRSGAGEVPRLRLGTMRAACRALV